LIEREVGEGEKSWREGERRGVKETVVGACVKSSIIIVNNNIFWGLYIFIIIYNMIVIYL